MSTNGSAPAGTRPRIQLRPYEKQNFKEFHKLNLWQPFTPVYNSFLESILSDEKNEVHVRLLALALLTAGGNQSLYSIDEHGVALKRSDCGRILEVRRQRITEAVRILEAKNLLHERDGCFYPVSDPFRDGFALPGESGSLFSPPIQEESGQLANKRRRFQAVKSLWNESHADRARQLADARALVKEITREQLEFYKWVLKAERQQAQESGQDEQESPPLPPEEWAQDDAQDGQNCPGLPPEGVRDSSVFVSGTPPVSAPYPLVLQNSKYLPSSSSDLSLVEGPAEEQPAPPTTTTTTPLETEPEPIAELNAAVIQHFGEALAPRDAAILLVSCPSPKAGEMATAIARIRARKPNRVKSPFAYLLESLPKEIEASRTANAAARAAARAAPPPPPPMTEAELEELREELTAAAPRAAPPAPPPPPESPPVPASAEELELYRELYRKLGIRPSGEPR